MFLTPTHLAIAMEYAQGGDLFNYTLGHRPHGRLAEQQARWIFQQLIIGLDYCHRRVSTAFTLLQSAGVHQLWMKQQYYWAHCLQILLSKCKLLEAL